ncbi:MAG: hypothetical protein IKI26_03000, partial [Prevotella sp.]|nr:hypothetical protein [Prevotella sp.]
LQERVFNRLFEQAEIARFSKNELFDYEESLKVYRDLFNVVDTAEGKGYAKGKAEGILENKLEMAVRMKKEGLDSSLISKITGLSIEEINIL